MTGQRLLEQMAAIRDMLHEMVTDGLETRFVDMQLPIPREVEFDFLAFQQAFYKLHEHGDRS